MRRYTEGFMKNLTIIPIILFLFICFACDTEQKGPSHLDVGTSELNSGRVIDAIQNLKEAEKKEEDKAEPRALLVIAYSHALSANSKNAARTQRVEPEYKKERAERIAALNAAEINKMIEHLSKKRSVFQADGFQALVDKGTDAAVVLIDQIVNGTYPDAEHHFISNIVKIGSDAVDPILNKVTDAEVSEEAKMKLIHMLGEIGDKKAIEKLKSLDVSTMGLALKMELYTTLYRLGEMGYKSEILAGLKADEVEVRRAAAKAMANLKDVNTRTLINALKDSDSQVVTEIVKALSVHKSKDAVDSLINVFKGEYSDEAKSEVLKTLTAYAEAGSGLTKGLARKLSLLLIKKEIKNSTDRVRLVLFLQHSVLVKQLKAAKLLDDLDVQLFEYLENEEEVNSVKTQLHELLSKIRK